MTENTSYLLELVDVKTIKRSITLYTIFITGCIKDLPQM